jgi:hypothetical protein
MRAPGGSFRSPAALIADGRATACGRCRAIAATLALAVAAPAHAFEFDFAGGDVNGFLDTTISVGSIWRTQSRNPGLIAIANGGTSREPQCRRRRSQLPQGGARLACIERHVDFSLKYRDFGMFARAVYFHDWAASDKDELGPKANAHTVSYERFLDLYAFGKFDFSGRSLFVRAGDQIVNWGESTFIRNGINILNPVDLEKLRNPGAELKKP